MAELLAEADRAGGGAATGGAGEAGGGGRCQGSLATRHRASGSGSSLGGDAEFAGAGVVPGGTALLRDSAQSGGSSGGGAGGEYILNRGGSADVACGQQQYDTAGSPLTGAGPSGEYAPTSAGAATGQLAAAAAPATPAPGGASDDPGATPAHPRAVSRTAAAQAGDAAAGPPRPSNSPPPVLRPGGGSGGPGVSLEALVYHSSDSAMKPIVGNKRCVGTVGGVVDGVADLHHLQLCLCKPCPRIRPANELRRSLLLVPPLSPACRIERPLESMFNPSLLPFQPLVSGWMGVWG